MAIGMLSLSQYIDSLTFPIIIVHLVRDRVSISEAFPQSSDMKMCAS